MTNEARKDDAPVSFEPTHSVPDSGLQAWDRPDSDAESVATLDAGLPVRVIEDVGHGWVSVECENGWTCFTDGSRLIASSEQRATQTRSRLAVAVVAVAVVAGGIALATRATTNDDADIAARDGIETPDAEAESDVLASFDDARLEEIIAEAEASPLEGLPGRDTLATEFLVRDLTAAGVDLAGIDLVVYPAGSAPPFLLMTIGSESESTLSDTAQAEALLTTLLASPVLEDFEVERLVLRADDTDDQGPFTVTMMLMTSDLRTMLAGNDVAASVTDPTILDRISFQVERTS